jgi:lipoyl(octanoyl) transferase
VARRLEKTDPFAPALSAYFLDRVPFAACLELQQGLVADSVRRGDGQSTILLGEHPPVITIGRGGSPSHIRSGARALRSREIEVLYVNRGGGCLVHCPGQLSIYVLAPLEGAGFTVGDFLERLQVGLLETLEDLQIPARMLPGRYGLWGRTGQLAFVGVAVRNGVTYYGAYLNVSPPLGLFRLIEPDEPDAPPASSLAAERCRPVRMTAVRAALVPQLARAFGCDRYYLHTGHPWLKRRKAEKDE